MMTKTLTTLLAPLLLILSCSHPGSRTPSSESSHDVLRKLYELENQRVEWEGLYVYQNKKRRQHKQRKTQQQIDQLKKEIQGHRENFTAADLAHINELTIAPKYWRYEIESFELTQPELYEVDKKARLSVSDFEAQELEITLTHQFFADYRSPHQQDDQPTLQAEITCQSPFETTRLFGRRKHPAQKPWRFTFYDKKLQNGKQTFYFKEGFKGCQLSFVSSLDDKKYALSLVPESSQYKNIKHLLNTVEVCSLSGEAGHVFQSVEFHNKTCPTQYDEIKMLPEPEDSLTERVQVLLGQPLPADFLKNGNPYAPLDFSKALELDAILVSYLVFRADFYGTLLARMLAHHADKGTLVRIVASDVITLKKDKKMYEKMMANHPNMKFVRYSFDKEQQGGAKISELHRTNHVKLFVVLNKTEPEQSIAIVGGRNVHDGFVFRTPPDVTKFPDVVNYNGGDESWAYWRDFEMTIKGQKSVESIARHFMSFYLINKDNMIMKLPALTLKSHTPQEIGDKQVRHYVSIPFKDINKLNNYYAELIDSAKTRILISTPYFRPIKEISDALERAVQRGVDVVLVTRLDLEGDTADFILSAVNKDGVNKFKDSIKVYEYLEPKVILHSKLLMIDEHTSFISSVNLNKRSFYHDLENGVLIEDSAFNQEVSELFDQYLSLSEQITEKQRIIFWKRWIIRIFDKVL